MMNINRFYSILFIIFVFYCCTVAARNTADDIVTLTPANQQKFYECNKDVFVNSLEDIVSICKGNGNVNLNIKDSINLKNSVIVLPDCCCLKFCGGNLQNGTIIGNNTFVDGEEKVFQNIELLGTFTNENVSTNLFKDEPSFRTLLALTAHHGVLDIERDIRHDGNMFVIKKSITINGNGHKVQVPTKEPYCTGYLFGVEEVEKFKINNLTIDGSIPVDAFANGCFGNRDNFRMLLKFESCDSVFINGCTIANVYYNMVNSDRYVYDEKNILDNVWKNLYNFAHWHFIAFISCKYVEFSDNELYNINSEEGLCVLPKINENVNSHKYNNDYAVIRGNRFVCNAEFVNTKNEFRPIESRLSSWLNLFYGKCTVESNEFGCSLGSQLNLFCYNSKVRNNIFRDTRTVTIDLNENGFLNFIPSDVVIENNTAYSSTAFISTSAAKNVLVRNNLYDCTSTPEGFGSQRNLTFMYMSRNVKDQFAPTNKIHPTKDLRIVNNKTIKTMWFFCDWNYYDGLSNKDGLTIENNTISNRVECFERNQGTVFHERPVISLASFSNVRIKNNNITGAGRPLVEGPFIDTKFREPVFILLHDGGDRLSYNNINIENNNITDFVQKGYLINYRYGTEFQRSYTNRKQPKFMIRNNHINNNSFATDNNVRLPMLSK